jgi:hypothetical protein
MKSFGDWKGTDTSYLHDIQDHCRRHPSLKLLHALPHAPEHPTRVKVLEFYDDDVLDFEIDKLPQLEAYWAKLAPEPADSPTQSPDPSGPTVPRDDSTFSDERDHEQKSQECKGRLYLVEDISLPYISSLGSHFTLDPRFFVEYLKFDPDRTQNFISGYHTMRRLSSLRPEHHHSTFVYHDLRHFEGAAPRREEYEILTRDNVRRLVTTVDHHNGQFTALVRRNLSIWWREAAQATEAWDAIVLVDPSMTEHLLIKRWETPRFQPISCANRPYLDGYLDFSTWPPAASSNPGHSAHCVEWEAHSMLHDIEHYWVACTAKDRLAALRNPRATALFPHRILASHWNLQLDYLVSVVSDLEKGLLKFEQMDANPGAETINAEIRTLRSLLSDVNSWRRRLYFYLEQMKWNIEAVSAFGTVYERRKLGMGEAGPVEGQAWLWRACHEDFSLVYAHLALTNKRIQSLLPVVMGAFSLLEAQNSVLKADLTIRLSGVALVFVPLSFTASLLSMSDDFMPGKRLFWVYFVISGPLILALFWWAFWVQVGRLKRWGKGKWRGRETKGKCE